MRPYTEADRYSYPFTPASLIFDVGAYQGHFSAKMAKRYGCEAIAFEPVRAFYDLACKTLRPFPKVKMVRCAVGGSSRTENFHIQADSSGLFAGAGETQEVPILSIDTAMQTFITTPRPLDLLKLNCEGMEFEILERLVADGLVKAVRNIQVQFHWNAPAAKERHAAIHAALLKTHAVTWGDDPSFWTNYALKP